MSGLRRARPPTGPNVIATDDAVVDVVNPKIDVEKISNPDAVLPGRRSPTPTWSPTRAMSTLQRAAQRRQARPGRRAPGPWRLARARPSPRPLPISVPTTNTVVATGADKFGHKVSDKDDAFVDVAAPFTPPDLTIDKSADKTEAEPGDTVKYTLTYENLAEGSQATDIKIVDDFDERYVAVVDAAGGVVEDGTITWNDRRSALPRGRAADDHVLVSRSRTTCPRTSTSCATPW